MSSCNVILDDFISQDATLDVSGKYIQLMQDTLSDDSLYIRAKDTFKVIFDDLQLTEIQKAELVSQHVAGMTSQLSGAAMQTALSWSKEERDGAYMLAKIKAETELTMAQALKAEEEICLTQKQTEKMCADITATISGSYRENGIPTGYEADGCKPTGLDDTGLKFHQTKQVMGATYQIYADAFRKSGIVQVRTDTSDDVIKGMVGDDDGYTNQQSKNAERQRIAYEDSKLNHAANSSATMIGQLLSSETLSTNNAQDIDLWRETVAKLNTPHSTTDTP